MPGHKQFEISLDLTINPSPEREGFPPSPHRRRVGDEVLKLSFEFVLFLIAKNPGANKRLHGFFTLSGSFTMKYILFIATSTNTTGTGKHKCGYEFSEVADPYLEFINKGYTVDFANILGDTPPEAGYNPAHKNSREFRESKGFKRLVK